MKFGEFVQSIRLRNGLTLREFCRITELDPGNWSRIERGLLAPPRSKKVLASIATALGLEEGSDDWLSLYDLATISFIPASILDDSSIVDKLPIFFRTMRGDKPSRQELERLIEKIRKS